MYEQFLLKNVSLLHHKCFEFRRIDILLNVCQEVTIFIQTFSILVLFVNLNAIIVIMNYWI